MALQVPLDDPTVAPWALHLRLVMNVLLVLDKEVPAPKVLPALEAPDLGPSAAGKALMTQRRGCNQGARGRWELG